MAFLSLGLFMVIGPIIELMNTGVLYAKALIFGPLLILASPAPFLLARRNRGTCAVRHESGIVLYDGKGQQACAWVDVTTVTEIDSVGRAEQGIGSLLDLLTGESPQIEVQGKVGTLLIFKAFLPRFKKLREAIKQATLPHLLLPAVSAIESGAVLEFGPLRINREGVFHNNDFLPWDTAKNASIGSGKFRISKKGKLLSWKSMPVEDVPNAYLLIALVDRFASE